MKFCVCFGRLAATTLVLTMFAASSHAAFNIVVNYATGTTPNTVQAAAFASAEATWESLLADYLTPTARAGIPSLTITARLQNIDGTGGVLGSAGPSSFLSDGTYVLPTAGNMTFDTSDTAALEANGTFSAVILHEMAHVMGFGTLWESNPNVVSAARVNGEPTEYIGANALAQWRTEFGQTAAGFVPIERGGGSGTRGGHWAEVTPNTSAITDPLGRSFTRELMTGFLNANPYISNMTVQSFRDIGYAPRVVVVPEVGTMALLVVGIGALGTVTVRRRTK